MAQLSLLARWRNAVRQSDLDRTAKLVAYTIGTYMDVGGFAFPAKTTIATGASLSTKIKDSTAVGEAVARIEAAGLLRVARNKGRRGWTYQAVIPRGDVGFVFGEIPRRDERNPTRRRNEIPRGGVDESFESNGKPLLTQQEQTAKARELNERLLKGART